MRDKVIGITFILLLAISFVFDTSVLKRYQGTSYKIPLSKNVTYLTGKNTVFQDQTGFIDGFKNGIVLTGKMITRIIVVPFINFEFSISGIFDFFISFLLGIVLIPFYWLIFLLYLFKWGSGMAYYLGLILSIGALGCFFTFVAKSDKELQTKSGKN